MGKIRRITLTLVFACFGLLIIGSSHVHAVHLTHLRGVTHPAYPRSGYTLPSSNEPETIIISISGDTNTCGSILVVSSTGAIILFNCNYYGQRLLLSGLTTIFFHDVRALGSLNNLPVNYGCLKGASFKTTTIISFKLQTSPDVSCSLDANGKKLFQDVQAIQVVVENESLSL